MTPEDIEHIQRSWQTIALLGNVVPKMFYRRLCAIDASAHALFSNTDMDKQHTKFMETFGVMVAYVARIEEYTPILELLGRRHAAYGVQDHHYDAVGKAILSTIETGLGQSLTRETRAAWAEAYTHMSAPMRRATAV